MTAIRDCGTIGWLIVALGILGLAGTGACLAAVLGSRYGKAPVIVGTLSSLIGFLAIGLGPVGTMLGRATVNAVLAEVSPEQRERLRDEGYAEAAQCIPVGGFAGVLPLVAGAVALGIGLRRRKQEKSPFTAPTMIPRG